MIYNLIGRAVVKFGWFFMRREAGSNKRLLAGAGAAAAITVAATTAVAIGYLATRETPEA